MCPELKTLEWWISRSMLDPLFLPNLIFRRKSRDYRCALLLLKTRFLILRISGIDGVISIELMIDWKNISFGLMFIKANVQTDNSPQM